MSQINPFPVRFPGRVEYKRETPESAAKTSGILAPLSYFVYNFAFLLYYADVTFKWEAHYGRQRKKRRRDRRPAGRNRG